MEQIEVIQNVFRMEPNEISYRMEGLRDYQLEGLGFMARGMTESEAAKLQGVKLGTFRARMYAACDRVGVIDTAHLLAVYSIWEYWKAHYSVVKMDVSKFR